MQLYVVRHGEAVGTAAGGDAARPLTERGAAAVAAVGRGLQAAGVTLDALIASPLRRAQETARILARALGGPEPSIEPVLDGSATAAAILRDAGIWARGRTRVAIVGHQPVLGELVMLATAGIGAAGAALPPACVVRIDFSGEPRIGAGQLVWWMPPELLGRLSG